MGRKWGFQGFRPTASRNRWTAIGVFGGFRPTASCNRWATNCDFGGFRPTASRNRWATNGDFGGFRPTGSRNHWAANGVFGGFRPTGSSNHWVAIGDFGGFGPLPLEIGGPKTTFLLNSAQLTHKKLSLSRILQDSDGILLLSGSLNDFLTHNSTKTNERGNNIL